ncbi:MAG: Rpn family recombination-promoting nuclease/putative transposase [Mangrovibacterium sp.]
MSYLDPKNDLTFKKVFGEHDNLVMSLLNALLPLASDQQILSVEYLSPEMTPAIPGKKNSIVDVRCKDNKGRQFIVEMQMHWTPSFMSRVLLNATKAYSGQLGSNMSYDKLQPIYALSLVNETYDRKRDECYHHYTINNVQDNSDQIEGLEFVFVELPKFRPETFSDKKMAVLWLRYLTEVEIGMQTAPAGLLDNPEVSQALSILERTSYSEEELAYYYKYCDIINTELSFQSDAIKKGEEIGMKKGRKEGEAIGMEKAKIEMVRNMLSIGSNMDFMIQVSGLTQEEIEKIKAE